MQKKNRIKIKREKQTKFIDRFESLRSYVLRSTAKKILSKAEKDRDSEREKMNSTISKRNRITFYRSIESK